MEEEKKYTDIPETDAPQAAPEQNATAGEQVKHLSFKRFIKNILGGEILTHRFFQRQFWLLIELVLCAILYISNRYACQQKLIEIDRLKKELTDMKYNALTRSSELTEKSRQSKIEEYVSREKSDLQTSTNPPYLIK